MGEMFIHQRSFPHCSSRICN